MNTKYKTVSVIGLGYIGLPTAALLASHGLHVIGVDVDANTVDIINSGKVHIVEPDLDMLVHEVVTQQFLRAVTQPEPADAFLIAVPTPFREGYEPDLSYVDAAATSIAPVLKSGNLIILESTSPVGTTERVSKLLAKLRPDLIFPHESNVDQFDIHLAYCPERVMPGKIIHELVANDRIIGGMSEQCTTKAKAFYRTFVKGECLTTDSRTAEMAKLTENSFRDVNIAFANELSIICDHLKINVWELIRLANHHPRVNILQPGPGVGGHCIAVDPWFIVHAAPQYAKLIRMAREVNDSKPDFVIQKIKEAASKLTDPKIACLGITYKANTDDLRESPVLKIIENLHEYTVNVVEPNISELPINFKDTNVKLMSLAEALMQSDIVILMVGHNEFKNIDKNQLKNKIYFNFTNNDDTEWHSMLSFTKSNNQPVSDYGMMMMKRIYGQVVS